MKLGEALTLRARQSQKLHDLKGRIAQNCLVQEGDKPNENVEDLIDQYNLLSLDHAQLIGDITNANVDSGILEMITKRDHLRRKLSALQTAVQAATATPYSYSRTEIKWTPLIEVAVYQQAIEELESEINELDVQLQTKNWTWEI